MVRKRKTVEKKQTMEQGGVTVVICTLVGLAAVESLGGGGLSHLNMAEFHSPHICVGLGVFLYVD